MKRKVNTKLGKGNRKGVRGWEQEGEGRTDREEYVRVKVSE